MMKRLILCAACAAIFAAASHAATNRIVPTAYTTVQSAIDAAADGDTITLTDSATYTEMLYINKPNLKIVASTGQNPKIENSAVTSTCQVIFGNDAGGTKLGSLTGGRITLQYRKQISGTTKPNSIISFMQTTDSLVTLENVTLRGVGATTHTGVSAIYHNVMIPNKVTVRYCDFQTSRSTLRETGNGHFGVFIGNTTSAGIIPADNKGPVYSFDHVRMYGYQYGGILLNYKNTEFNASYVDIGGIGQLGLTQSPGNPSSRPNGIIYQSGILNAPVTARFDHCLAVSGNGNTVLNFTSNGSSVSLSRCALISKFSWGLTANYATINLNVISGGVGTPLADTVKLTLDHCDVVDLTNSATYTSPILRTTKTATAGWTVADQTTNTLVVKNSNLYSLNNWGINLMMKGTGESFTFDHCNMFGPKTMSATTLASYTPTDCVSFDPLYKNLTAGDFRYDNNTLKLSDSDGGPIGVNAGYADVVAGIVPGTAGVANRAHGWTTLK